MEADGLNLQFEPIPSDRNWPVLGIELFFQHASAIFDGFSRRDVVGVTANKDLL